MVAALLCLRCVWSDGHFGRRRNARPTRPTPRSSRSRSRRRRTSPAAAAATAGLSRCPKRPSTTSSTISNTSASPVICRETLNPAQAGPRRSPKRALARLPHGRSRACISTRTPASSTSTPPGSADDTGGVVCIDTNSTEADPFCGFTELTGKGEAPPTTNRDISGLATRWWSTRRRKALVLVQLRPRDSRRRQGRARVLQPDHRCCLRRASHTR